MVRKKEHILFYSFIVSQPVIDVATGFMTRYGSGPFTPGAVIRALLLMLLLPYIWKHPRTNRFLTTLLVASLATIGCTALISFGTKSPFFLQQEAVFYMKALYFVVSVLFIILYVRRPLLSPWHARRAIVQASYIIGGSYAIALLTRTSFPSYPHGEIGYSGWFFSANELSVIAIILFASVVAILREQRTFFTYGALFLLAFMAMFIGTKTAYIGVALLLAVHILDLTITYQRRILKQQRVWLSGLLCLLYFGALPLIPMTENSIQNHTQLGAGVQTEHMQDVRQPVSNVLSSRQDYVRDIALDFQHAPLIRNLFGLGYAGDYEHDPKMIEMDFFELFFSFGVIGTLILLTPLAMLIGWIFTHASLSRGTWVLLTGLGLTIGVAALAGHVFFAPSVMSYLIASAALLNKRQHV